MTQRANSPLRTVVADDSAAFRAALRRMLATLPHIQVIAEAADGAEALQRVTESAPDLLLLDLRMPKFNGLEVLQRLYAMRARVQVVVLSAEMENFELSLGDGWTVALVAKGDIDRLIQTLRALAP